MLYLMPLIPDPPRIVNISNVQVKEGEDVEIRCVATGLPLPTVEWRKDGVRLPQEVCFPTSSYCAINNGIGLCGVGFGL